MPTTWSLSATSHTVRLDCVCRAVISLFSLLLLHQGAQCLGHIVFSCTVLGEFPSFLLKEIGLPHLFLICFEPIPSTPFRGLPNSSQRFEVAGAELRGQHQPSLSPCPGRRQVLVSGGEEETRDPSSPVCLEGQTGKSALHIPATIRLEGIRATILDWRRPDK